MKIERILVYKRTHPFDPDQNGRFGSDDCLGRIRDRKFDAVIGVGATGREAQSYGIAYKVNWIGIGPHKTKRRGRASVVTFDYFLKLEDKGPLLRDVAPKLAKRIYEGKVRSLLYGMTVDELAEATDLLKYAKNAPPSKAGNMDFVPKSCRSKPDPAAH